MNTALAQAQTTYQAVIHPESVGGYWAEVPELPGCITEGDNLAEVRFNLQEAIACYQDLETDQVRVEIVVAPTDFSQMSN